MAWDGVREKLVADTNEHLQSYASAWGERVARANIMRELACNLYYRIGSCREGMVGG